MLNIGKYAPLVLPQGKLFICGAEVNGFNIILNFTTEPTTQVIPTVTEPSRATLGNVITVVKPVLPAINCYKINWTYIVVCTTIFHSFAKLFTSLILRATLFL